MKKRYVFTVPGNPVCVYKADSGIKRVRDTYEENKTKFRIYLLNQCEKQELINKPFNATFKFFMPNDAFHRSKDLSIIESLRFINHIAKGIIYKKESLMLDVKMKKSFSEKPHTEIIIKPI